MIIAEDSPFRRLPSELNSRQAAYFDAIRYSVDVLDVANVRLSETLWQISTADPGAWPPQAFASVLLDAWAIVDATHRTRELVEQTPGMRSKGSPEYQLFRKRTSVARDLRNVIHHLRRELSPAQVIDWPTWGVLTWLAVVKDEPIVVRSSIIMAGRVLSQHAELINPLNSPPCRRLDRITLQYKTHRLDLSDAVDAVAGLIKSVSPSIRDQFGSLPTLGGDICTHVDMQINREEGVDNTDGLEPVNACGLKEYETPT